MADHDQPTHEVTCILQAIQGGDLKAADELRRLAAEKLPHEKPGQTLQATALVHEACIRLVGLRYHFFGLGMCGTTDRLIW